MMRKAQLKLASADGKQTGEVVFFHFGEGNGGGTKANIDRFDLARPFAPWLYRIVVTRGLNRFRGRARHVLEALPHDLISSEPDPLDHAERDEVGQAVQGALAALPERQRLIVQLFEIDGFTSEEIGAMLELPAGTVRWHMHQARRALRTHLAPFLEARR